MSIHSLYEVSECAYQASTSRAVYPCKCKRTGEEYVMKMKRKRNGQPAEDRVFRDTVERLLEIQSDRLLNFSNVYEDELHFYMVMPKCNSGELFGFLVTEDAVSERECKRIIRELLEGLGQIHESGLIHRDLKPENVLLHQVDASPKSPKSAKSIKIIDFDTVADFDPGTPAARSAGVVGTYGYIAPEGYLGQYSPQSDLWSLGVIFYVLMTGEMPHSNRIYSAVENSKSNAVGKGMEATYYALQSAEVDWECDPWEQLPLARDLCQQLLAFRPQDRSPSAAAALAHPWLQPNNLRNRTPEECRA
jgi:serine/threonine protein kinase